MDIGTIVGLLLALVAVAYAVLDGGGSFLAFLHLPSLVCVLGGGLAAALICFPWRVIRQTPQAIRAALTTRTSDLTPLIDTLIRLAEVARRKGLLALELELDQIDPAFLRRGVQLAVDGLRPEVVDEILRGEIDVVAQRQREGKGVLDQIGRSCPAFGMIGTLLGLVMMLGNMTDPDAIGPGMAVALLTTLYGALLANAVCLPIAEKLGFLNRQEMVVMDLIVKGILGIQSGDNPRLIERRLSIYLPPGERLDGRAMRRRPWHDADPFEASAR